MENATKALLIAAAILIAILIISLSLVVYRMASETIGNVNLSESEMLQFNGKFTNYEGTSVSGSEVNALLATVFTHNQAEINAGTKRYVTVTDGDKGKIVLKGTASKYTKVAIANYYKVTLEYTNGMVSNITYDKLGD